MNCSFKRLGCTLKNRINDSINFAGLSIKALVIILLLIRLETIALAVS
jgi:hypothetical protein